MDHDDIVEFALEIIQSTEYTEDKKLRGVECLLKTMRSTTRTEVIELAVADDACLECTINLKSCLGPDPTPAQRVECMAEFQKCFKLHCIG